MSTCLKFILPTPLLLIGIFFSLLLSCGRKDIQLQLKAPIMGPVTVSDIKSSSAKASSSLSDIGFGVAGSTTVSDYGLCMAITENPTITDTKLPAGTSVTMPQDFAVTLNALKPGTKYFVRAYAVYEGGTAYGEQATFLTDNLKAPDVTTADAADLTTTAFSITGKLTSLGTSDVIQYGHVLSATNQAPTTADTKTEMGATNTAPKDFKSVFGSLKPNTIYYVRAYATNATGTGYSEVKTVKTSADQPPVVTTADATDLTVSSFNITGRVTSIGTLDVTQFGHCLSETNPSPTPADVKTEMGSTNAPKDFKSSFGTLKANATYYVRAYATNPTGTAYSDVKTIKTLNVQPPSVTTGDVSNVSASAATVGMTIVSVGTNTNVQAGVCWSNSNQNPTIADAKTANGATSPQFFSNSLTNLAPNTTYYVRAYATSLAGTGYGDVKSFKTPDVPLPIVTKPSNPSGIVGVTTFPDQRFTVTYSGSIPITEVGLCYSTTNQTPTVGDSKKTTTAGTGDKSVSIDNLQPNTTYYVRAYAQTGAGVGYSPVSTLKTAPVVPPVISAVKRESALLCASSNFPTTNPATYNDPCKSNATTLSAIEIQVSFTYESRTETPAKFGICLLPDSQSGEPTVDNPKVESGNAYSSLLGGYFSARFNVTDKTGNTKTVSCGACPTGGDVILTPCGNQTATEYIYQNPFALGYTTFLVGGGTKRSIVYKYRPYIIMTNGNVYYGPTTTIDPTQVCTGPG